MNKPILHGDVSLKPIKTLPKGLKKIKHTKNFVIRHGESGHRHVIVLDALQDLDVYINPETSMHFLNVKTPIEISHEEHRTLVIEPGFYEEGAEIEYNPFEKQLQKVVD